MTRQPEVDRWFVLTAYAARGIGYLILALGTVIPFVWMISTSLKPDELVMTRPLDWFPAPRHWDVYLRVFSDFPFFPYLANTLTITIPFTLGSVLASSSAAYGLACLRWPDRDRVFALLLGSMMLPPQVTMIPLFMFFRWLGWIDTFKPLIVPAFLGNVYFIFLLRQFFKTLPRPLLDAARIDGCSEPRIFASIILPLSKPALATVTIFAALAGWNEFFGPLIYIMSEENKPLALGLQGFLGLHRTDWALLMAVSVIITLPAIGLFLATQRFFVKGIALSGLKG